jgi:hypothetical protein
MQPQHIHNETSVASFAGLLSAMTAAKELPPNSFPCNFDKDAPQNHPLHETAESVTHLPAQRSGATTGYESAARSQGNRNGRRNDASVTFRMSREEFIQLQARSVEANLTMSAYLRSCTFEAESLRAQVKQVLAELRNLPATAPQPESAVPKWLRLLRR